MSKETIEPCAWCGELPAKHAAGGGRVFCPSSYCPYCVGTPDFWNEGQRRVRDRIKQIQRAAFIGGLDSRYVYDGQGNPGNKTLGDLAFEYWLKEQEAKK